MKTTKNISKEEKNLRKQVRIQYLNLYNTSLVKAGEDIIVSFIKQDSNFPIQFDIGDINIGIKNYLEFSKQQETVLREWIRIHYLELTGNQTSKTIEDKIVETIKNNSDFPFQINLSDIINSLKNYLEQDNDLAETEKYEADKYDLTPTKKPKKKTSLREKVMKTYKFKIGVKPPEILLEQLMENLKSNSNYPNCHSGDINSTINNWLIGAANDKVKKIVKDNI